MYLTLPSECFSLHLPLLLVCLPFDIKDAILNGVIQNVALEELMTALYLQQIYGEAQYALLFKTNHQVVIALEAFLHLGMT